MPVLFGLRDGYVCGEFGLLSKSYSVYCWIKARIAAFDSHVGWLVSQMSGRMRLSTLSSWRYFVYGGPVSLVQDST